MSAFQDTSNEAADCESGRKAFSEASPEVARRAAELAAKYWARRGDQDRVIWPDI